MPTDPSPTWQRLLDDPLLLYTAAAAALLLVVSLSSGAQRRDAAALSAPRVALRVLGAVALAFAVEAFVSSWSWSWPGWLAAVGGGLHRLPLYVVTLAYGPTVGAAVGLLFAGFHAGDRLPGWPEAVLVLELSVLGWLAILPSPRTTRLAGTLEAPLAYGLAWGTAGLTLLAWQGRDIDLGTLRQVHGTVAPGVLASAALLALFGPKFYETALPNSRIHPTLLRRGSATVRLERPVTVEVQAPTSRELALAALRGGRTDTLRVLALAGPEPDLPGSVIRGSRVGSMPPAELDVKELERPGRGARRLEPRALPDDMAS